VQDEDHDGPVEDRDGPTGDQDVRKERGGTTQKSRSTGKVRSHSGQGQVKVRRAAELLRNLDSPNSARTMLRFRWINDGEAVEVRPVTTEVVVVPVHRFVPDGSRGKVDLQCAGTSCALCLAGNKPEQTGLLLLYWLEDRDFGVLRFKLTGHPASVAAQLLPLLDGEDATEQLIEISRSGKSYSVQRICSLDPEDPDLAGADVGEEALADLLAEGEPGPEELANLIEKRPNQNLILDLPWLAPKLRRRGIDTSSL